MLLAGAFLVNTGSSQLLDDCALKQLLIDDSLAGCALDGAEGPQWMEAWVRKNFIGYEFLRLYTIFLVKRVDFDSLRKYLTGWE